MSSPHEQTNQAAWDQLAQGSLFGKVATDEECRNPLGTLDSRGWLPPVVAGLEVLCLASGGGWQSILYASAGARVTVVDLSPGMLELDRREALKRNLQIDIIQGSMLDLSLLEDARFDIVHQPVSTCYVPDLEQVYKEVARVLRDDGLYISQHKTPTTLQVTQRTEQQHFVIGIEYYHTGPLPEVTDDAYRETGATEYLHRWDVLVGGLCRAGFVIEDLREPCRADYKAAVDHYGYRGRFVAPYVRMKARRRSRSEQPVRRVQSLWLPRSTQ